MIINRLIVCLTAENDLKARAFVKNLMMEAGLEVSEDAMGNIYGTLAGSDPEASKVVTGSHIDAIPKAGAYDGTIGMKTYWMKLCCIATKRNC